MSEGLSHTPEQEPEQIVTVFIASENTAPSKLRALWRMSEEDARKVCTDPRTAGRRSGLHWTAQAAEDGKLWRDSFEFVEDDGRFLDVLFEHGITVVDSVRGNMQGYNEENECRCCGSHIAEPHDPQCLSNLNEEDAS